MMFQSTCSFHCNLSLFLSLIPFLCTLFISGSVWGFFLFSFYFSDRVFSLVCSWIHSDLVLLSLPNSGTTEVSHRSQQQTLLARLTSVSLWVLVLRYFFAFISTLVWIQEVILRGWPKIPFGYLKPLFKETLSMYWIWLNSVIKKIEVIWYLVIWKKKILLGESSKKLWRNKGSWQFKYFKVFKI